MELDGAGNPCIIHYNPTTGFEITMDTGNGVAGRTIPSMLQSKAGTIARKRLTTAVDNWRNYNKISGAEYAMNLNTTVAQTIDGTVWNDTEPTENGITVGTSSGVNLINEQYITYLQADSANHVIKSYHGTGAVGNVQDFGLDMTVAGSYVMIKYLNATGGWFIYDTLRASWLYADTSDIEGGANNEITFTSTGIVVDSPDGGTNALGGLYLIQAYSPNYAQPTGGSDVDVNVGIDLTYTQGIGQTNLQETTTAHTVDLSAFAGNTVYIHKERGSDATGSLIAQGVGQLRGDLTGSYLNTLDKKVYDAGDLFIEEGLLGEVKVDSQGNLFDLVEYPPLKSYFNDIIVQGEASLNANVKIVDFGTVFNDNRYVINNPFGNENYEGCIAKLEVFYNEIWSAPSITEPSTANAYGALAHSNMEGIVVQTANVSVIRRSDYGCGGHGIIDNVNSAPARVIVTKIGDATDA